MANNVLHCYKTKTSPCSSQESVTKMLNVPNAQLAVRGSVPVELSSIGSGHKLFCRYSRYNFFRQLSSSSLSMWYPLFFHSSLSCCSAVPISFPEDTPIFRRSWPLTGKEGTVHSCISFKSCSSPWYLRSSKILELVLASLD